MSKINQFRSAIKHEDSKRFLELWADSEKQKKRKPQWAVGLIEDALKVVEPNIAATLAEANPEEVLASVCRCGRYDVLRTYLEQTRRMLPAKLVSICFEEWQKTHEPALIKTAMVIFTHCVHFWSLGTEVVTLGLSLKGESQAKFDARCSSAFADFTALVANFHLRLIGTRIEITQAEVVTAIQQLKSGRISEVGAALESGGFRSENIEREQMMLVEMILDIHRLGRWVMNLSSSKVSSALVGSPNRDKILGAHSSRDDEKLDVAFKLLTQVNRSFADEYCPFDDEKARQLKRWYQAELIKLRGKVESYDSSDDSDSEQEKDFYGPKPTDRKRKRDLERHQLMQSVTSRSGFWDQTRRRFLRSKPSIGGKADSLKVTTARANLPHAIDSAPEKKQAIALYRGVNYIPSRWSKDAKRTDYYGDSTGKPYYSEAARMAASNFYREETLSSSGLDQVDAEAERLRHVFTEEFQHTGPCIGHSVSPQKRPFFFNSFADYLAHRYSNGINTHLMAIADALKDRDHWLQGKFKNAYNYAVSASERPYHSLRYALGLKDYYPDSFDPIYNMDGGLNHFHAGKLHIFLFDKDEFVKDPGVARITSASYQGKIPVAQFTAAEIEITFYGKIDGKHAVYEFPLRFPTFDKPYRAFYEVKYGLDEETYLLFKKAICNTGMFSEQRNEVITLLKEWLCAYYEVMAVYIASEIAESHHQAQLVYIDKDNSAVRAPIMRPFTPGEPHISDRNRAHILFEFRHWLAEKEWDDHSDSHLVQLFGGLDLKAKGRTATRNNAGLFEHLAKKGPVELSEKDKADAYTHNMDAKDKQIEITKAMLVDDLETLEAHGGASTPGQQVKFRM